MKKQIIVVLTAMFLSANFAGVAHAKKLENVTTEEVATGVQNFIANSPENLGKVAYHTITITAKVIAYPFKQLEKLQTKLQNKGKSETVKSDAVDGFKKE